MLARNRVILAGYAMVGRRPGVRRGEVARTKPGADIYAPARSDLSDELDGALGQDSLFDRAFGYYADGVEPAIATLPMGG